MRNLFAATAVAAALVLVPVQARLEPLAFVDSDANAPSDTTKSQSGQNPEVAAPDVSALSPGLSDPRKKNHRDAAATPVQPQAGAGSGASVDAICATLDRSAAQNSLPLEFFTRLIWQESRFNPFSVSHAGAQGIAQFMPGTARLVGLANPFDPLQALPKSAELLRGLLAQFGNLGLAAAAYNAGPKRVEDWLANRKTLPQETEAYVRIITGRSAQEWTSAEARNWGATLLAPGPCEQLARPVPHRVQPVIAFHRPDRPTQAIVVARRPDRPAHAIIAAHQADRSPAAPHQPDRSAAAAHQPAKAVVKLTHLASNVAAGKNIPAPKSIIAAPKGIHERQHLNGASSTRGSTAEASHALRREQPAASHKRSAPSPRPARLA